MHPAPVRSGALVLMTDDVHTSVDRDTAEDSASLHRGNYACLLPGGNTIQSDDLKISLGVPPVKQVVRKSSAKNAPRLAMRDGEKARQSGNDPLRYHYQKMFMDGWTVRLQD